MSVVLNFETTSKRLSEPLLEETDDNANDSDKGKQNVCCALSEDDERRSNNEASCCSRGCLKEQGRDYEKDCNFWTDCFIIWCVLPLLLFLQFGMSFAAETPSTRGLSRSTVNFNIALFALTSYLFRRTLRDLEIDNIVAVLIPEIVMDMILGLVLFDHVVGAFVVLLETMFCLALFVVGGSIYLLYTDYWCKKDDANSDDDRLCKALEEDDKLPAERSRFSV